MKRDTTRFEAPTSTELTLNDLRFALINALIARQRGGDFLLRIADRDPGASAFDPQPLLDKCLLHDRLQHQSENLRRYRHLATTLLQSNHAYACTCDPAGSCDESCPKRTLDEVERLYREKLPYTLRVVAPDAPVTFDDIVRGDATVTPETIGSFPILLPGGIPSACFSSAVDDMLGGVTTVIRDTAQHDQTAREIYLRTLLGFTETIAYGHITPLTGDVPTLRGAFEAGFLPDALIAYLLSVGQTPPEPYCTLADAVKWYDLSSLGGAPTPYDPQALRADNRHALARMDDKALSGLYRFADADIGRLIRCYLDAAPTLAELDRCIHPILAAKPCVGEDAEALRPLSALIISAPPFATFEGWYAYLQNHTGLDGATLHPRLAYLLTGTTQGPAVSTLYPHLKSYLTEVARCQP